MTDKNIGIIQNGIYVIGQKGFSQNVPVFQGGKSDGVFNGGDNSFIVCINDTAYSDIADYTKLLEEKGYTKTFENKIGDNIFYGYSNGENLISVYFIIPSVIKNKCRSVIAGNTRNASCFYGICKALPIIAFKMGAVAIRQQAKAVNKHEFVIFSAVVISS